MRKNHRPYYFKRLDKIFQQFYTSHFVKPHLDRLGKGVMFIKPWHVEIFGPGIEIGDYTAIIAAPDKKVRLSVWSDLEKGGRIFIGSYCLISPGVRISAACCICIKDNCMIAANVYITDCDWHGIYNRISLGSNAPIMIEENVWIGDSAIICKGVTIGKNSIVGAGAVVTKNVPPNTVAAGNPAAVVKHLDPEQSFVTRSQWLSGTENKTIDRVLLQGNSIWGWLRYLFFPAKGD